MLAVGGAGLLDKMFTAFVWGVLWHASAGGAIDLITVISGSPFLITDSASLQSASIDFQIWAFCITGASK